MPMYGSVVRVGAVRLVRLTSRCLTVSHPKPKGRGLQFGKVEVLTNDDVLPTTVCIVGLLTEPVFTAGCTRRTFLKFSERVS